MATNNSNPKSNSGETKMSDTQSQQMADQFMDDYNNSQVVISNSEATDFPNPETQTDTEFVFTNDNLEPQPNSQFLEDYKDDIKIYKQSDLKKKDEYQELPQEFFEQNDDNNFNPEPGMYIQANQAPNYQIQDNPQNPEVAVIPQMYPIANLNQPNLDHKPKSTKISLNVLWFILAVLTFISFLTISILAYYNYYQNQLPTSKFTLVSSNKTELKPDTAMNTFYINLNGTETLDLNTKSDIIKDKFVTYLKEQGVTDKDIVIAKNIYPYYFNDLSTTNEPEPVSTTSAGGTALSNLESTTNSDMPNIDIGIPREPSKQITVQTTIEVTFKNIQNKVDNLDVITAKSLEIGITRFSGYTYKIDNTETICKDLYNKTLEKLIKEADEQLKILGGDIIVATEIKDTGYYNSSCQTSPIFYPYASDNRDLLDTSSSISPEIKASSPTSRNQELQINLEGVFEYR